MIKPVSLKSKWLVGLILVAIVTLLISGGCAPNTLPVISSLVLATQSEINPGGTAQIECNATDADDDELSYEWSADGGTILGSGANVSWTAPDELGIYTITVEVSDGSDIATDQLTLAVLPPNNPPSIVSLTTDCPRVKPAGSGTITCEATDPDGDELIYKWSAERGTISGDGPVVTWTAPSETGNYSVTVEVSDGRGGEATSSQVTTWEDGKIRVCHCGSACD